MLPTRHLSVLSVLVMLASAYDKTVDLGDVPSVCAHIATSVSNKSEVFCPDDAIYEKDLSHSSKLNTQECECSVEPGTTEDVGTILNILGSTKTPFSVKGGGHSANPGFSSSPGIQIAMYRFSEINYSATLQSAVVGSGLVWDEVYATLAPHEVTVIGGRVPGVGVAGLALGGGYSFKTNQYGLTLDTILAYELVKPDGQVVTVTDVSDPELFFALRGGFNNFGIVTRITLRTFPQGMVWGGSIGFNNNQTSAIAAATAKCTESVTDLKSSMITTYTFINGQLHPAVFLFYDDHAPPLGIFDDFLAIPSFSNDIKTRDYPSLVQSSAVSVSLSAPRDISNTVSLLAHTPKILDAIVNETILHSIFLHSPFASAYPPSRSVGYYPLNILLSWNDKSFDSKAYKASRQSAQCIYDVAIAEGQDIADAPLYPNYAIFDTPLERMYEARNVARLKRLRVKVDPHGVMDLCGGFKF